MSGPTVQIRTDVKRECWVRARGSEAESCESTNLRRPPMQACPARLSEAAGRRRGFLRRRPRISKQRKDATPWRGGCERAAMA